MMMWLSQICAFLSSIHTNEKLNSVVFNQYYQYHSVIKFRFASRPNLIYYKAYTTSQKCALMHDAIAYACDIQNMSTRVVVKYLVKL